MSPELLSQLSALLQVIFIDLVLAGDNAIVVGIAVAGLDPSLRKKAILYGLGGAVLFRILFSLIAVQLLQILGLELAGGLLLLWVAWKLYRELRKSGAHDPANGIKQHTTLKSAVGSILLADISMSLDNALAVAGAAREHMEILVAGLLLSVILMAVAANWVARVTAKHAWVGYLGLAVVLYVAISMIVGGGQDLVDVLGIRKPW